MANTTVTVANVAAMKATVSPDATNIYYLMETGKQGSFYFIPGDTKAENIGTVISSTTTTGTFNRIYSGQVNVQWFGAVPDAILTNVTKPYVTATGTDNTSYIQSAVNFLLTNNGGTLFFPNGKYLIQSTVYINLDPNALKLVPISLLGESPNNRVEWGPGYGGTILTKTVTGDMFKVNLDASGKSVLTPPTMQWFNFDVSNLSFIATSSTDAAPAVGIVGFNMFRTRCTMQNLSAMLMDYLVYQAATDTTTPTPNPNYCDQSIYKNIYFNNPSLGGLYLYSSDTSLLENINCEQNAQQSRFNNLISIFSSDAVAIRNVVSWVNPTAPSLPPPTTNSTIILIQNCTNTILSSIHMEHLINVFAGITIKMGGSTKCEGINVRFDGNDTFQIASTIGVVIDGMAVQKTNNTGCYDINFIDNNSTNVTWANLDMNTSPTSSSRAISVSGYNDIPILVSDANYNALPYQIIRLPTPTANRTLNLPNALNFSGKTLVIWNQNTSTIFSWQFGGSFNAKNAAGVNLTTIPNQSILILEGYGTTNWVQIN